MDSKKKSHRERKNPTAHDEYVRLNHEENEERPKQIWIVATNKKDDATKGHWHRNGVIL